MREHRKLLDRAHHPFHQHAAVEYFLAFQDGRCVGRIAAIQNHAHNQYHEDKVAFFGFLDAEPREEVFRALLHAAEAWAASRGLSHLRGPMCFSTNEELGVLLDNHLIPAFFMTSWNPSSYPALIEACGYGKAKDLYSYWLDEAHLDARVTRLAERVREKFRRRGEDIVVRPIDMSRFRQELDIVRTVYNSAWDKNWGFVPMTNAEIEYMAKDLKPLVVPELIRFAEVNGEPAAFCLSMPDYNIPFRYMEGRMGPLEIMLFLLMKKRIHQLRMLALGISAPFRSRGLETLLIADTIEAGRGMGFHAAELSWVLEDNVINRELRAVGGQHYKTHRIYEKELA